MNYFQSKLDSIMKERHLSQTDLAIKSGIRQSTISSWFQKDITPKLSSVEPVAKVLGVSVSDLIGDFGNNLELSETDKQLIALPQETKEALIKFLEFANSNQAIITVRSKR